MIDAVAALFDRNGVVAHGRKAIEQAAPRLLEQPVRSYGPHED